MASEDEVQSIGGNGAECAHSGTTRPSGCRIIVRWLALPLHASAATTSSDCRSGQGQETSRSRAA